MFIKLCDRQQKPPELSLWLREMVRHKTWRFEGKGRQLVTETVSLSNGNLTCELLLSQRTALSQKSPSLVSDYFSYLQRELSWLAFSCRLHLLQQSMPWNVSYQLIRLSKIVSFSVEPGFKDWTHNLRIQPTGRTSQPVIHIPLYKKGERRSIA